MKVTAVAQTLINWQNLYPLVEGTRFGDEAVAELHLEDPDHLAEFAGRACYLAWGRQNAATATTEGYLKRNILGKQHFSVLEHASVSFYVQGVSRSLLLELERHRFLSFSVESQRYVDQAVSHPDPVVPPAMRGRNEEKHLRGSYREAMDQYILSYDYLTAVGYSNKDARSAARAYLPNCTPVDFLVTANMRAWREIIQKRRDPNADAEIREFAAEVLAQLRKIAPLSVQDITD